MDHLLYGLAVNPALPAALVERLIDVADAEMAGALAERGDLSAGQALKLVKRQPETAVELAEAGVLTVDSVDPLVAPVVALALLGRGAGDPEWTRRFAVDPAVEHRVRLAACPGLPEDVVEVLAGDVEAVVVAGLAEATTSVEVVARLAGHPHAEVRKALAGNEVAPPAVLASLITGEGLPPLTGCLVCDRETVPFVHDRECPRADCDLRTGASCDGSHESTVWETHLLALGNPTTPLDAVIGFLDHPMWLFRERLAARPDLPPEAYRRLAADPVPGVRWALAENPAIGDAVIRELAREDTHVRRQVALNPRVPLDVLADLAVTTKIGPTLVPRIATATQAEVQNLALSPTAALRMLLAHRRDLPARVRDVLAADHDAKVVKAIAPDPGLSETQLRAMIDRHGTQVLGAVARNPAASSALLEDVVRHLPPSHKAFRAIAEHPNATAPALLACLDDDRARPLAAAHPALPPETISELLTDDDGWTAQAAAANPSLPPEVMASLVGESRRRLDGS
ncbi:hypothetical protein [Actinokineospora cianjurensis]|uniref:Leucine rich repeat (LRR) protein n=1 Tax=Actinokineospora cianjurensis TaxID=585224 RepID=A0A421B2S6_9PSEU|nr:hypothetical protein [Actinokineospora cianjurensis]RLK58664.1 hypothetical protein CLV68_3136 [Actinokineospora cianjurensis]